MRWATWAEVLLSALRVGPRHHQARASLSHMDKSPAGGHHLLAPSMHVAATCSGTLSTLEAVNIILPTSVVALAQVHYRLPVSHSLL